MHWLCLCSSHVFFKIHEPNIQSHNSHNEIRCWSVVRAHSFVCSFIHSAMVKEMARLSRQHIAYIDSWDTHYFNCYHRTTMKPSVRQVCAFVNHGWWFRCESAICWIFCGSSHCISKFLRARVCSSFFHLISFGLQWMLISLHFAQNVVNVFRLK